MKVLVAMSGGVDSSVAAGLLVRAGHEVVGATLQLWGATSDSGCCSVSDVDDARRVAQTLGIDHHVFNFTDEFEHFVVEPYVAAHAAARTPNPCIECNRHIKFDLLFQRAWRLGFDAVATGHHARVVRRDERTHLARGVDAPKDQSYVLGFLGADVLERLLLPVGEMSKAHVRELAHELGLRTWDKPDSQDVCFIEASRGREAFLASRLSLTPARVIDARSGEDVGALPAAELVTLGQRRGVAAGRDGERRYVSRVDLDNKRVYVDSLEAVRTRRVSVEDASLCATHGDVDLEGRLLVQFSAHGAAQPAHLHRGARAHIDVDSPVRPVAPGQSVVFYDPEEPELVVGAGVVS